VSWGNVGGSGFGTFVYSSSICVVQVNENINNLVVVNIHSGKLKVSDWLKIKLDYI